MILGREPVLFFALARAIVAAAIIFGLPITPEQKGGLLLVVETVLALYTRSKVSPARKQPPIGDRDTEPPIDVVETTSFSGQPPPKDAA